MNSKSCMINLMADVIGLDDKYTGDKLNNQDVWEEFIDDVFKRIDVFKDKIIKDMLNLIDRETFQIWIDDPNFWLEIDEEIVRRGQIMKTMIPLNNHGHC